MPSVFIATLICALADIFVGAILTFDIFLLRTRLKIIIFELTDLFHHKLHYTLASLLLLNEAFQLDFIIYVILDVAGSCCLNYDLHLALSYYVCLRPRFILVNDSLIIDAQNWSHLMSNKHDLVMGAAIKHPVTSKLLVE